MSWVLSFHAIFFNLNYYNQFDKGVTHYLMLFNRYCNLVWFFLSVRYFILTEVTTAVATLMQDLPSMEPLLSGWVLTPLMRATSTLQKTRPRLSREDYPAITEADPGTMVPGSVAPGTFFISVVLLARDRTLMRNRILGEGCRVSYSWQKVSISVNNWSCERFAVKVSHLHRCLAINIDTDIQTKQVLNLGRFARLWNVLIKWVDFVLPLNFISL